MDIHNDDIGEVTRSHEVHVDLEVTTVETR